MSHDVFVSYAAEDSSAADAVCRALEDSRLSCWIAPRDLLPGREYASEIVRAISESRVLVLIFSSHANQSPLVRRELERAASKGITIVPLRIEDVDPADAVEFFVSQHHWLDAITPPLDGHLEALAKAVSRLVKDAYGPAAEEAPGPETRPPLSNPAELVGHRAGPYTLTSFKGSGGGGHVYLAWHEELGRKVCVKVLHPSISSEYRQRIAVSRAVRALARIDHPSIAKVHDYGLLVLSNSVLSYIVMDWIEGKPLNEWNRSISNSTDALRLKFSVAGQLAEALSVAHTARYLDENGFEQCGLLHGDIKPSNVLVRTDSTPVLVDFAMLDIQRLLDPRVAAAVPGGSRTPITTVFGTSGFMAPEQERDGIVTVRTDLFGLGVTLWPLFYTERLPSYPSTRLRSQARGRERFSFHRKARDPLRELFLEMMNPDPNRRPPDAATVARRIAHAAQAIGVAPER